jgi:hypothetical protein
MLRQHAYNFESAERNNLHTTFTKRVYAMKRKRIISRVIPAAALLAGACVASAQQSFFEQLQTDYERFRGANASMTSVQPTWMGPVAQTDPRLGQVVRISVSNLRDPVWAPGGQVISYGNNQGISIIIDRRIQLKYAPPSFFRNHTSALKDGFGNSGGEIKYRIVSGNAEHGNYILTADLTYSFAARGFENGALTPSYSPKLASGVAFGRFDVQAVLSGALPTGKIAQQGRDVEWDTTGQVHATTNLWIDLENGATFNIGGGFPGTIQDLVTPAAYYSLHRRNWGPNHLGFVFDAGMQIATTRFHFYNHNVITEVRVAF